MDEIREFFSRIKLVRMRTPNMVKIALIVAIVLCMGVLVGLRLSTQALNERTEALHQEAVGLQEANRDLEEKKDALGTIQSVIDTAKEKLGLVEPGTVMFETGPAPATESSEAN